LLLLDWSWSCLHDRQKFSAFLFLIFH
jgi:hypothetical protein